VAGDRGEERRIDAESLAACPTDPSRSASAPVTSTPSLGSSHPYIDCLQQVFAQRIFKVAPVPLQVYLGAVNDQPRALAPGPVAAAAGLVAILAIVVTALLSRRVLRPIAALTSASRRLGEGGLGERVPVVGRDELAELARSFNRMADSLQRGEERQRRLIADVAHELRTPLANLRGYLEALKDGVMPPDPELFASLHEEAVLQQRIVDDLQDLALAEAGALVYRRTRVDLGDLLETCRVGHHAVADAAGVRLAVSAPPAAAEPIQVHADPDRLRQVVGNLVTNALRATAAGGSVVLAAARTGATRTITVTDTGSGISATDLPHVFDRFWRADAARSRTTGGSGLGLAIAHQIVTDHGGTMSVASTPGVGTTFTIVLPAG
jgi:two-component system sensor histidine kinase BaeS